jgi:oligopeptide transport system ATP-binding protein
MNKDLILKVENLEIAFKNKNEIINIIRGIDLKVKKGQIVGIVGESGSGKSVTIKSLLNLNGSNAISSANKLQLKEVNLNSLNKKT